MCCATLLSEIHTLVGNPAVIVRPFDCSQDKATGNRVRGDDECCNADEAIAALDGTQLGGRTLKSMKRVRVLSVSPGLVKTSRWGIAGKEPGLTGDGINVAQLQDRFNCLAHTLIKTSLKDAWAGALRLRACYSPAHLAGLGLIGSPQRSRALGHWREPISARA